jgi:hypothetical protein
MGVSEEGHETEGCDPSGRVWGRPEPPDLAGLAARLRS